MYAPVHSLSDGAPGAVVVAPGDTRGTVFVPEKRGGACCGIDGADGPNMACATCGLPVASRIDDCSLWQAVWLAPDAVRRVNVGGAGPAPLSWAELAAEWTAEGKGTPPFEPIAAWWGRPASDFFWSWSPRWEAAAGRALAHLLAASEGRRVTVPEGLTAVVFQRALDAMLLTGPPVRRAVLAGPGLPAPDPDAGILLVPEHPRTGEAWASAGSAGSACRVPLPFGIWRWLSLPEPHPPVPASGVLPDGVLRDDPPAPGPHRVFRMDRNTFEHTLVRLPPVRDPWLRAILADLRNPELARLF